MLRLLPVNGCDPVSPLLTPDPVVQPEKLPLSKPPFWKMAAAGKTMAATDAQRTTRAILFICPFDIDIDKILPSKQQQIGVET
jgi:hypothetical protein